MSELPLREEFRCEGCNTVITQQQYEKVKKVLGKGMCPDCARKESAESMDAAMTPRDKVFAWLARNNFEEQRTVKGFFILDGPTKIAVDMNKPSDIFPGAPVIGRLEVNGDVTEEGHGVARIDDVRQTIMGLLKSKGAGNGGKVKKEIPSPKAEPKPKADEKPTGQETALAKIRDLELSPETIIKYICPDATFEEAVLFLQVCKGRNLNPFIPGEVFLVKYDKTQPAATVVGKYAFTKKADEHKDFKGYIAGIIVRSIDGKIEEREGTFYLPKGNNWKEGDVCEVLLGGWARVKRMGREVFVERVALQEVIRLNKEGRPVRGWRDQPATMVRKTALVRALREAFPAELGGLYDEAEIIQEVK